jgi:hypothetical protein
MWSWLVIGLLYVVGIGAFHIVGGMSSAMDALRDWGRATTSSGQPSASSS